MGGGAKVAIFVLNSWEKSVFLKLTEVINGKKNFVEGCVIIWCNFGGFCEK